MNFFTFIILIGVFSLNTWAVQKAKIISPEVDVYISADFDSDVLGSVKSGETYFISDKVFGPFFKIKLKNGKIGFIPDTEVYIEGKGLAVPGAANSEDDPFLQSMDSENNNSNKVNNKSKKPNELLNQPKAQQKEQQTDAENDSEDETTETSFSGLTLQLINFHEETMGAIQVDDLLAIGYKSLSDISWEIMASFKVPKYYSQNLDAKINGFNLWSDLGISNEVPFNRRVSARYGGGLFLHLQALKIESEIKNYDLHEISFGALLEGALLFKFKNFNLDASIKYFFDKKSYGGLGISLFF